ncbi:hypothetical protein ABFS82_04G167200 [Erythranthe guttata]
MKSFVRISALLGAEILVTYAFFEMQNYLTNVWHLSFTHAAGILNLWNGISMVLPLLLLFVVDTITGNFAMLVLSSTAYTLGTVMVAISTPPLLANATGTCKQYEPHCVGRVQKTLFYTGMAFVAVGIAGHLVSLHPFLEEQQDRPNDAGHIQVGGYTLLVLLSLTGAIALPFIKPWSIRFGIPAICTALATLLYLTGWCKYDRGPRGRVPLSSVCRVFATKVPVCTAVVVCGMVSAIRNTYFVAQANHLNRRIGGREVPIQVLLLILSGAKQVFAPLADKFLNARAPSTGMGVTMVLSVLCCVTAAETERRRLDVVRSHGLVDKPDEDIPMTVYWLVFQFVLLAGVDSFFEKSIAKFCDGYDQSNEESLKKYLGYLNKGVCGVGFMCSALSVYAVGKISERVGGRNWFEHTLNESRLDNYFLVLACLSGASLIVLVFVGLCIKLIRRVCI